MSETLNLADIPDLTEVGNDDRPAGFDNGWYEGVILEKREFTDNNGNDRVFESTDAPSSNGESRNIRLQVVLTRRSDKRQMNVGTLINYQPTDLTQETVQAVTAQKAKVKEGAEWGPLFRAYMTLSRLAKLQKIAGVRQLQRNGNGGLDLHPLYGKKAYFKVKDDDRNPQYKAIADFRETEPTRVPVL